MIELNKKISSQSGYIALLLVLIVFYVIFSIASRAQSRADSLADEAWGLNSGVEY